MERDEEDIPKLHLCGLATLRETLFNPRNHENARYRRGRLKIGTPYFPNRPPRLPPPHRKSVLRNPLFFAFLRDLCASAVNSPIRETTKRTKSKKPTEDRYSLVFKAPSAPRNSKFPSSICVNPVHLWLKFLKQRPHPRNARKCTISKKPTEDRNSLLFKPPSQPGRAGCWDARWGW